MSGLSDTSAFEAFNRMAEEIEEKERHRQSSAMGLYEAFGLTEWDARQGWKGLWTIRIDGQYRIAFKWTDDGVEDFEIINSR